MRAIIRRIFRHAEFGPNSGRHNALSDKTQNNSPPSQEFASGGE